MKFSRFNEYSMAQDFINSLESDIINESFDSDEYKSMQSKITKDFKLNIELVSTFGAGIGFIYPIVSSLMNNMNISSIELTADKVVLATITAASIIYLEEKKLNTDKITKDCKSMLEELKLMGIGNGLIKKLVEGLKSIRNIFSLIGKHIGKVIIGFIDMFAYTAMLIPIMNGILSIVGKYDLNLDTLPQNFIGLGMGVGTIIAKHGISEIINKLKGKFNINKKKVIDEIDTPIIQKIGDMTFGDSESKQDGELIKEQ